MPFYSGNSPFDEMVGKCVKLSKFFDVFNGFHFVITE